MKEKNENILMGHGSGGQMTERLIKEIFLPFLSNAYLNELEDASTLSLDKGRYAFTTDSFTVYPLFFPGGDIGKLAVTGTINDLVVSGAKPLFISAGFILEEGFPIEDLKKIVKSISETVKRAKIFLAAGDTKVVERGKGDGVFINTTGLGLIPRGVELGIDRIEEGDEILVTGTLGDHGASIVIARGELGIQSDLKSDCAPLDGLIIPLLKRYGQGIHWMRDPTRGGVATVLNEAAKERGLDFLIFQREIPIRDEVHALSEMLGFDPLYLANEGKAVIIVKREIGRDVLLELSSNPLGRNARRIGVVTGGESGRLFLETESGGTRILDSLIQDQVPRIC